MTGRLHWQAEGPDGAPALVLLNSVGSDLSMWDPVVGPLAEQLRVVRIDTRGHGRSAPQRSVRTPDVADLGADVLGALDELGLARVDLAGLSLGGMTAMWLAIHHPERVARLALLCTSAHLPPAQAWHDRATSVRADGMPAVADAVVARWVTPGLAERDPVLLPRLRAMLTGTDAEDYAWCCEAIAALDLRPDLPRIAAPTVVLAGADDPATPPGHGAVIAAGIPGARLVVVEDAAHLATVEQPGVVATVLRQHFVPLDPRHAGQRMRRSVLGDAHVDRSIEATTPFSAPFQDFITRYAWGEVWTRAGLTRRERSIATLAALVALGADNELPLHVRGALRNGLTAEEIGEILLHTTIYAGVPRANSAVAIAQRVLAEEGRTAP